jgi:hypothetical protein
MALVVLFLAAAVPVGIAGGFTWLVGSSCACASTPTPHPPGWTPTAPPRVSAQDAAITAARFSGVPMKAPDWVTVAGRPVYEVQGDGAIGFVDGTTGAVLEMVIENKMPNSDTASVSVEAAGSAAREFLSLGGVTIDGPDATTQLVHRAPVAFYDLTWSGAGAAGPDLEVFVDPATGTVFAYRDLRTGVQLTVPVLGFEAAMDLARESNLAAGETPNPVDQQSAEFPAWVDPLDAKSWTWMVGFPDGYLTVDAATGDVSVAKWSAR